MSIKKFAGLIGGAFLLLVFLAGVFGNNSDHSITNSPPSSSPSPANQIQTIQETAVPSPTPSDPNISFTQVAYVIDGDTIEIANGQRVRLIGIDTPETVDPNRPAGCFGQEASDFTKAQLTGKEIKLEKDVSETDKFGRLLRYIWLGDTLFNETLVKEGYAQSSTYPPDVKYQDRFIAAQQQARNASKGLWGSACATTSTSQTATPHIESFTTSESTTSGNSCLYSCSGPDRDCSDFATHSEAQTFFICCGFSAGHDPMRLDKATGTGNGLACESLP